MANTKQQTVKDLISRSYENIGIKTPITMNTGTKKEQYKTEDPKYSNKSSNELIASTISNNLKSENTLKSEVATNKAIKFFNDRSEIRKQFIDGTRTTWNVIQDKIGNNKSELADAIRKQFINEWYKGTDWFGDEMLFQVLYKNNPQAEWIIDYFANNWWDADSYAYYIMHPERFREEKPDSSVFTDIVGWAYDVATSIPRTIATLWAKWIWAVAKWLWADEKNVDRLVQSYIDSTRKLSWEWMWADTDSLTYKISKAWWELAMLLWWAWVAKWALKWVDVASKIWMWNAPTWVKWLGNWAAKSMAEWISEQALDDMVEQRLSSVWQYWTNIGINAFFNWLWEIWGKLLYPNEKMTKVLKNVDPNRADDIVKQTKQWVKDPLAANPLDSKMDDVVTLSKEVADTKSKTWKLLWKIRDVMKYDTSKNITSSVDDINLALNEIDDLWGVNIIQKADWTFGLSDRVIWWWGKELEDLVADMNTLVKKSNNLRWYDQIQRLANKYSWEAKWPLSAALKKAAENMSNNVDDILSKYTLDTNWKVAKPWTTLARPWTELAVKWAGNVWDNLPPEFISNLKEIYGQWKSNYKLLSEFNDTLEALANDWTKWIKKLTNIFWDAWWENYYRFLKSLESLWYDKAWKLADEIVGTVYTMWLYGKDLMEESVKKFYPSVPWLYELWIKSALDVARKNVMWPAQIAAWKTSVSNPVWDAIRAVTATQYLWEINE